VAEHPASDGSRIGAGCAEGEGDGRVLALAKGRALG
jgi:hypothetical protein